MRGRKPTPKTGTLASTPMGALPRCPAHLSDVARKEWRRLATPLHDAGILTLADRAALAAYCQAYARWVEAEEKLAETPTLLKTPNGHVQQSPWLSVANKQLELMGRYMSELGLTPSARSRLTLPEREAGPEKIDRIEIAVAKPQVQRDCEEFERRLTRMSENMSKS
ncbi:phage terminase small subunit P27 family [Roseovarius sp. TE539]|uniref:phage terminase small subunit P27 family n=1 Tax=Roseovarius sp. TE539 TaxID=2249812 RepID=UPI000DDCB08B|nr:phage terminase small subunit P27 family [Roseovarius sp. TE539]RBI68404.1 phage terminase small subunit P27 family [Roseovarius sp. TE539]